MVDYRLYLVTGSYEFSEEIFLRIVEAACQAGVTLVQLREKTGTTQAIYQRALRVKAITDWYQIPLIINDRVDICLAVDAAGIHIGDEELPVAVVRQLIGPDKLLGVSAKTIGRAQEAKEQGADYLGVGAMFPTQTKEAPVTAISQLVAIQQQVQLPIVAIGGIKATNLAAFKGLKIAGVAVVSEIMQAMDVTAKVQELRAELINVLEE